MIAPVLDQGICHCIVYCLPLQTEPFLDEPDSRQDIVLYRLFPARVGPKYCIFATCLGKRVPAGFATRTGRIGLEYLPTAAMMRLIGENASSYKAKTDSMAKHQSSGCYRKSEFSLDCMAESTGENSFFGISSLDSGVTNELALASTSIDGEQREMEQPPKRLIHDMWQ